MKVRTATTVFVTLYILSTVFQTVYVHVLDFHGPKLLYDEAVGSMHI